MKFKLLLAILAVSAITTGLMKASGWGFRSYGYYAETRGYGCCGNDYYNGYYY